MKFSIYDLLKEFIYNQWFKLYIFEKWMLSKPNSIKNKDILF